MASNKQHALSICEIKKIKRLSKLYLKITSPDNLAGLTLDEKAEYNTLKDYLISVLPIDV